MKTIIKLLLNLGTGMLISGMTISPAVPQEIDSDTLCIKFPLNSRCQNHHRPPVRSNVRIYQFDRDTFCKEFWFYRTCHVNSTSKMPS